MANINGTNKGDRIRGTAQGDFIDGRQGDDILFGGAGNDTLLGGVGRDTLHGEEGDDYLDGGNGGDELIGGAGNDRIVGGHAGDVAIFSGNSGDYRVEAGPLPDSYIVTDLRPGSPDGTDLVSGISLVGFVDGDFDPDDLVGRAPVNRAPVANGDSVLVGEQGSAAIDVLGNDSDPDGDALAIVSVDSSGAAGTVSVNADGTLGYVPAAGAEALQAGQTMTDSFTYTMRDSANNMATATVAVTVVGAADAPQAAADSLTVAEDSAAVNVTAQLLANDSDVDAGDSFKVTSVQAVSAMGASVSVSAEGQVSYDPGGAFLDLEEGETATDSFTYTVTDSTGLSSTATATVTITGVSQPPLEPDAYFYVQEDGTNDEMLGSIGEFMGIEVVGVETDGLLGTLEFDYEGGILDFTADHDSSDALNVDQQQWTYFTVHGAQGESALIGMVIEGVNDQIVAVDDSVAIGEGATSANLWSALVGNDVDPDNGVASRRILSVDTAETDGAVSFNASTRTLTYSAAGIDLAPGETITDSFTYTVTDGISGSLPDTATVTVTVTGAADGSASVTMSSGETQAGFGNVGAGAFADVGEAPGPAVFEASAQLAFAAGNEWQLL